MLTSFWKILLRETVAPVSSFFLCSHNNKSMNKRDVDFIMWNISSRMKTFGVCTWCEWGLEKQIPTHVCFIKKINKYFWKKCKRNQILKSQIFIAKQYCFSEACICYKQTRRIYTEIESFKERVWFTCLALIAVSSFLLK